MSQLIADSGATKCEWRVLPDENNKSIVTPGISPYFMDEDQIVLFLNKELIPQL